MHDSLRGIVLINKKNSQVCLEEMRSRILSNSTYSSGRRSLRSPGRRRDKYLLKARSSSESARERREERVRTEALSLVALRRLRRVSYGRRRCLRERLR
jgi:hypothetical protein